MPRHSNAKTPGRGLTPAPERGILPPAAPPLPRCPVYQKDTARRCGGVNPWRVRRRVRLAQTGSRDGLASREAITTQAPLLRYEKVAAVLRRHNLVLTVTHEVQTSGR